MLQHPGDIFTGNWSQVLKYGTYGVFTTVLNVGSQRDDLKELCCSFLTFEIVLIWICSCHIVLPTRRLILKLRQSLKKIQDQKKEIITKWI